MLPCLWQLGALQLLQLLDNNNYCKNCLIGKDGCKRKVLDKVLDIHWLAAELAKNTIGVAPYKGFVKGVNNWSVTIHAD